MVTNKKSTFLLAIFLAQRNAFTFIFTYQVLDAPIFNFVIFLAEDIVKLLLARSCWKEISYDILGKEIFNKEQSCKISIVLFWPFKSDRVVNICSIRASLKKWHFKTMTRFIHTWYLSRTPRTLSVENFLVMWRNLRCGDILDVEKF